MPEWLLALGKIAFWSIFGIGCWTSTTSAWLYFRDRSGNSGRENHWAENPRIKSPGEDEADDLYRAMAANLGIVEGLCPAVKMPEPPSISDADIDREIAKGTVRSLYAKIDPQGRLNIKASDEHGL